MILRDSAVRFLEVGMKSMRLLKYTAILGGGQTIFGGSKKMTVSVNLLTQS